MNSILHICLGPNLINGILAPICGEIHCPENENDDNCRWNETSRLLCKISSPLKSAIIQGKWILPAGTNQLPNQHITLVFNAFVIMTLFNEINSRILNGKRNIFAGIQRNFIFLTIWFGSFFAQVPLE